MRALLQAGRRLFLRAIKEIVLAVRTVLENVPLLIKLSFHKHIVLGTPSSSVFVFEVNVFSPERFSELMALSFQLQVIRLAHRSLFELDLALMVFFFLNLNNSRHCILHSLPLIVLLFFISIAKGPIGIIARSGVAVS